ncbi:MAG: M20/M25/M40 family metallo-hydrolase [Candidatus Eisenbacteria bacterium]|nr:M20/M25/M40 family metallo-hydrolase [Candidatus Eisenbacteria bacterium]
MPPHAPTAASLLSLLLFIGTGCGGGQPDVEHGDREHMLATIRYLSSPALRGRGVDSPGLDMAAGYIRREMERHGLVPGLSGGYFQTFQVAVDVSVEDGAAFVLRRDGDRRRLELGEAWTPEGVSRDGAEEGLAIVVWPAPIPVPPGEGPAGGAGHPGGSGHPAESGQPGAADHPSGSGHPGGGVHGGSSGHPGGVPGPHAALVIERLPGGDDGSQTPPWVLNPWGFLAEQAHRAAAHGAQALLVSADPWENGADSELELPRRDQGYVTAALPVLRINPVVTKELLREAGISSPGEVHAPGRPLPEVRCDLDVSLSRRERTLRNVVGRREGGDEWILVGAHYDGLGLKTEEAGEREGEASSGDPVYYPGADDNASGIALLLELARRTQDEEGRGRGIIFAAFAGEEIGLAGSRHMARAAPVPLDEVAAMVNVDMVGRLGSGDLLVMGVGSGEDLGALVEECAGEFAPLSVKTNRDPGSPSDQAPFYAAGVPVVHIMTQPHADYHRTTDTWEKIDLDGLEEVTDFTGVLVDSLRRAARPQFQRVASGMRTARPGRGYGVYLGTVPDFAYERSDGVRLSGVNPGSPAEAAGLQEGDLLQVVGDRSIASLRDYAEVLRAHEPGEEVEIVFVRDGARQSVTAVFQERD